MTKDSPTGTTDPPEEPKESKGPREVEPAADPDVRVTKADVDRAHTTPPAPRSRATGGSGGPLQFLRDVNLEMKRVSWPTRSEVLSTTVVVMIAVVFFGLYLWGVDSLLTFLFATAEAWLR